MGHDLLFHALLLMGILGLYMLLIWVWPRRHATTGHVHRQPAMRTTRRSPDPKPFPGLTHTPHCDACERTAETRHPSPSAPPPRTVFTRGRRRAVDTSSPFCPHPNCSYQGWGGFGNIRANGHPGGGPWRQLYCLKCQSYFQETHGTLFHGKRVSPEQLGWAVGALAEGLGIRAVARVFEVEPNTVLPWLIEAADHLQAFSRYFLHHLHVSQVQLDELFALLSAVTADEVREAEAIERLSRSPHGVWMALDPVTKRLLTLDVGDRTLAMAQGVVHQVGPGLGARRCAPVAHRGVQGIHPRPLAPFRSVGTPTTSPGPRAWAQAPLEAAAPLALCPGGETVSAPAAGGRAPPGRLRHPGQGHAGAGPGRLADQHGLHRARQPIDPPACGGRRATRDDAVQARGGLASAAGLVSCL
jgi:hypothetical protein